MPASATLINNRRKRGTGRRKHGARLFAERDGVPTIPTSLSEKIMAGEELTLAEERQADEQIARATKELKSRYFAICGLSDKPQAVASRESDEETDE